MASPAIPTSLRGLVLTAAELKQITGWPDALVEDYLNILDNLVILSGVINQKQDILRTITVVDSTMSPYEVTDEDQTILVDTTAGNVIVNLLAGTQGRRYRFGNVGTANNTATINPFGTETIVGAVGGEILYDTEILVLEFDETQGWW